MTADAINIHATAIVVGRCGLLFVGSSGAGKSTLAFNCLASAAQRGIFSRLVSDDQVFVRKISEGVIAEAPSSTAGLMELRGSGIVKLDYLAEARLHLAIQVIDIATSQRLPPEDESYDCAGLQHLPMIRLRATGLEPLAAIAALRPEFAGELGV